MKIAIGTKSPPKIKAVETASKSCVYFKGQKIELISEKVQSGISDMPLSIEENIQGSRNRANNIKLLLKSQNKTADFYVGIEGGTTLIGDIAYLVGIVYIMNRSGEEHFGISNMMEVPSNVKDKLYDHGEELGPIMDSILKQTGTKKGIGAIGYWSDGMFTRESEFNAAFVGAISPFYNKYYKL